MIKATLDELKIYLAGCGANDGCIVAVAESDEVIIPVKTLKQWAKIIREYYLCTSPADLKRKQRMGNVLTAITAESLKGG